MNQNLQALTSHTFSLTFTHIDANKRIPNYRPNGIHGYENVEQAINIIHFSYSKLKDRMYQFDNLRKYISNLVCHCYFRFI